MSPGKAPRNLSKVNLGNLKRLARRIAVGLG